MSSNFAIIMLDPPSIALCPKLCQHIVSNADHQFSRLNETQGQERVTTFSNLSAVYSGKRLVLVQYNKSIKLSSNPDVYGCPMIATSSPVAQCKILARSIQRVQKHQTLHGCSLGRVSQYQDRCPQPPLQDLQQLRAEVLQQPYMMGALC